MSYLFIFFSGTFSAAASVLLRLAGMAEVGAGATFLNMAPRPLLMRLIAIAAYGAGFAFYALALRRLELALAYPAMVTITLLELLLYSVATGSALTPRILFGAALLVAGIFLLYVPGTASD